MTLNICSVEDCILHFWKPPIFNNYSRVPNRRVGWNKRVGGKIAGNLINKLDGIKELVGNCTKAKNELIRNFSNFITLKIENHFNSTSIIGN